MNKQTPVCLPQGEDCCRYVDLIGGPGGLRSLTAMLGTLIVLRKCRINRVRHAFGVSGGSLPLVLFAAGYTVSELVEYALSIKFTDFVDMGRSHNSVVASHLAGRRRKALLPRDGVYHTSKLGEEMTRRVAARVNGWPKQFSTVALDATMQEHTGDLATELPQVFFNASGIFRRRKSGAIEQLSDRPAPIGLAIRSTIAVPLILEPTQMDVPSGERLTLFDGALSWEGAIPLGLVDRIAVNTDRQVIVDVGDETGMLATAVSNAVKIVCGGQCLAQYNTEAIAEDKRRILIAPNITALRSFEFAAGSDKKWLAIGQGLTTAVAGLARRGLLVDQNLADGQDICAGIREIHEKSGKAKTGEASKCMEQLLVKKGWL